MKIDFKTLLIIFLVGLLGGVCGTFGVVEINRYTGNKILDNKSDIVVHSVEYPTIEKGNYTNVIDKAYNSVVEISSTVVSQSFFGTSEGHSLGSGVIISDNGYIVTNNHVVSGATAVSVKLHDGVSYDASLIGTDPKTDLAVIKIEAENLPYSTIADSSELLLGEECVVIGNPLGLGITCSNGIVSALEKEIKINGYYLSVIQTNAAVNEGNSGGGMFNMNGDLIGIVNAKSSSNGSFISSATVEGMGYAIPANTVKKIVNDLVEYGYVRSRAALGITVYSSQIYQGKDYSGLLVSNVIEGSGAYEAGMKENDVITKVDDEAITSYASLSKILDSHEIGDTVNVEVYRNNEPLNLQITLKENSK